MMHTLNEIVGLPLEASSAAIAHAADLRSEALFSQAAKGDVTVQHAVIELQFAYLVWAYAKPVHFSASSPDAERFV